MRRMPPPPYFFNNWNKHNSSVRNKIYYNNYWFRNIFYE